MKHARSHTPTVEYDIAPHWSKDFPLKKAELAQHYWLGYVLLAQC